MRKAIFCVLGVLVLLSAMPAWANHIDRGTSSSGVFIASNSDCTGSPPNFDGSPCLLLVPDPADNIIDGSVTFLAFQVDVCTSDDCTSMELAGLAGNGNGETIYEIPDFSADASVTLTLASNTPDFGSFQCSPGITQCVNNMSLTSTEGDNADGTFSEQFNFPPGTSTGNSANPGNWFFFSDPQGCDDTGGSEDCSGSTGKDNVLGISTTPAVASMPEPGTLALLGSGLFGLLGISRRSRLKA
jgi:PEP-CTERM motif